MKLGKLEEAEKDIMTLISLRGDLPISFTKLAIIKFENDDYDSARILSFKAASLRKDLLLAWIYLGKACYFLEQYEDASEALSQANLLDPYNIEVWIYLLLVSLDYPKKNQGINFCARELLKLNFNEIKEDQLLQNVKQKFI